MIYVRGIFFFFFVDKSTAFAISLGYSVFNKPGLVAA